MLPPGNRRSPTRASLGTASLSISSLLVFSSMFKLENPVTLPPGRARLATRPAPTGSTALAITIGMVRSRFLRRQRRRRRRDHDQINLKTNQVRHQLRYPFRPLLGKPVLDGDILSLNPSKLAELLQEHLQQPCHTSSSASIEETDAEDFPCLLRLGERSRSQKKSCQSPDGGSSVHFFSVPILGVENIFVSGRDSADAAQHPQHGFGYSRRSYDVNGVLIPCLPQRSAVLARRMLAAEIVDFQTRRQNIRQAVSLQLGREKLSCDWWPVKDRHKSIQYVAAQVNARQKWDGVQ